MTSILADVLRGALFWLFLLYSVMAISHFILQLWFAHRTYRASKRRMESDRLPDDPIAVDVLVPVYNEEPALLERCVRSALRQDHPGSVNVVVVDDGSPNRVELEPIYEALEAEGATVLRLPRNAGKRHAQAAGLHACLGALVVTLDSDSILRPDAVRLLARRFRDPRVGAATGFIDVENHSVNILTRLQRLRYWMAFNQERASQTWFRTVMCCSGPLSAYRRELMLRLRSAYLGQMYGGVACTFGDDRHLTNLVLMQGYDTVLEPAAVAMTHVPESFGQFVRQQLRWSKSFFRELTWTLPYVGRRPRYVRFDIACQVAMPMILPLTATAALVLGVAADPMYAVRYLALIALVGAIRSSYGALRTRDVGFYLFVLYGFLSAFVLVPIRFRALWTLTDARWGTRGLVGVATDGLAAVASAYPGTLAPAAGALAHDGMSARPSG